MPQVSESAVTETVVEPEIEVKSETKVFNPETLSEDVKGYLKTQIEEVNKKYVDYDKHKIAAQEWEGVKADPRFIKFNESLSKPPEIKPFEVTDEQFTAALNDKQQLVNLINQAAEKLINEKFGPQLEQTNQKLQFQEKVAELQQTVAKYPDFKELDKQGLIEPIVRKYPSLSFEDAYWLARKNDLNGEADRRAYGIIDSKKKASIEKGGNSSSIKGSVLKAKNRQEALELAYEAAKSGRPIPEFDEIGD